MTDALTHISTDQLKAQAVIGLAAVATGIAGSYIAKRINPTYGTIGFMVGGAIAPIILILLKTKKSHEQTN